jgi:hypothetical protein
MLQFFELHFKRYDVINIHNAIKILRNTGLSPKTAQSSLDKLIDNGFFSRTKDWLSSEYYAPCSDDVLRGYK